MGIQNSHHWYGENLFTNTELPDISTNVSSQSIAQRHFAVGKTDFIIESRGEMGSFPPLWMDDKLQPLQNIVSLGKRLPSVKIELYFSTFRHPQLWWLICVLLFPPQPHTRRHHYRITEKFEDTQNLLCKARLYTGVWGISGELCLHKHQELQRGQAAADPASPQLPKVTAALQALPCHLHITQLKTNTPSPLATAAPDTWAFTSMAREPLHLELEQGMFPGSGFFPSVFLHLTAPRKSYR